MARPHSYALQYLEIAFLVSETLRPPCPPYTAWELMGIKGNSLWLVGVASALRSYWDSRLSPLPGHQCLLSRKTPQDCSTVLSPWHKDFFCSRWPEQLSEKGCRFWEKQPAIVRFAVSYFVFILGWQVPSLVVPLLASVCDFAAVFLSASKSCQPVTQPQWLWIDGLGSQKPDLFPEYF